MPPLPARDPAPSGPSAGNVPNAPEAARPLGDREKLMSLLEISKGMGAETNLDSLLELIMREATRALGAERSTLFLLDPAREELWSKVALGLKAQEIRIRSNQGVAGFVATKGYRVNIPDAYADPRFSPEVDRLTGTRTKSVVAAPVRTNAGELLGVLEVLNKVGGAFSAEDEELLEALASQAAVAIHNAQLYDELRCANAELKQLDAMKSNFMATISHELRTPLAPILGYLQLFLSETEAPGPLTDRQHAGVDVMLQSAQRLQDLIEDILTFLNLERGELGLNRQRVPLEPLLREQADGVTAAALRKGVELQIQVSRPMPAVLADGKALGRAVRLILDNAIKFTPSGGRITLSASLAGGGVGEPDRGARGSGSGPHPGEGIRVAVADTGIGIPEDQVPRIFESFYQVDSSTTRHFGGAGFGLTLVRRIIEAHGSQVSVESRVGAGSTFAFILPFA